MPKIPVRRFRLSARTVRLSAVSVLVGVLTAALAATPASATPPGIPSKSTAQLQLNALTVAAQGSMAGYSRALFPHWITISR
jgi:hypothetical protein